MTYRIVRIWIQSSVRIRNTAFILEIYFITFKKLIWFVAVAGAAAATKMGAIKRNAASPQLVPILQQFFVSPMEKKRN